MTGKPITPGAPPCRHACPPPSSPSPRHPPSPQSDEILAKQLANPQFVGAGDANNPIVLRDDGQGGDDKADDLVFTGLAFADIAAVELRRRRDEADAARDASPIEYAR
mgnify:CR=1 FL=1